MISSNLFWLPCLLLNCNNNLFSLFRHDTPATVVSLPPNVFSPLISQKIFKTASAFSGAYPQYTSSDTGEWVFFSPNKWTSGFFPAMLYEMQTRSRLCPACAKVDGNSIDWLELGREQSRGIAGISRKNTVRHDVGFMSLAFQAEVLINPENQTARDAVNGFAKELAARYSPVVGCTRSWDSENPEQFQVIIDNMMNLQVLFASAELTGNKTLRNIAMSHADQTIKHHVREDGSSFHVVDYNATTGTVITKRTHQGYSTSSTWSRGQGWGILGFAMMYQYTNVSRYLDTSRRMATYFLEHTPANGIIPWDFDAPGSPPPSDTSAAMIAANGYLLLSSLEATVGNISGSLIWENAALNLLKSTADFAWRPSWESVLSNGTVNNPEEPPNNNTGTVYGDYYFIKAGNRLLQRGFTPCSWRTSWSWRSMLLIIHLCVSIYMDKLNSEAIGMR